MEQRKTSKGEATDEDKLSKKSKLKYDSSSAYYRKRKLQFEKNKSEKPLIKRNGISDGISMKMHQSISEESNNSGVDSAVFTESSAEKVVQGIQNTKYSRKLKVYNKTEKIDVEAHQYERSNPYSKWRQKQEIKKEYVAIMSGKQTLHSSQFRPTLTNRFKKAVGKTLIYVKKQANSIAVGIFGFLMIMTLSGSLTSCSLMLQGGGNTVLATSYTAEDEAILGAEADYSAKESILRQQIENVETTHAGYNEYRYELDEINHNPYELAAYLTVLFEDYSRNEVQSVLNDLFERQYELKLLEEIETRTHVVKDPITNESKIVEYEYRILTVILHNKGLRNVIESSLNDDQAERFDILLRTKGNREYLFGDDIYSNPSDSIIDYTVLSEALSDIKFANMIQEAEKYLGYPYVWGGANPMTSFDCSGFVSWVINHSNNGWNVGRLTANGLVGICDIIYPTKAKPGDLIFFEGTYDTQGASHVGIYVGEGMMIHCGNPISYASIETEYWQKHFYCFGRIK